MPVPDPLITTDPGRMAGTPCFTGTRVPIYLLFEYLEDGAPLSEFLDCYPDVTRNHAVAVLELARKAALAEATKVAAE